MLSSSGRYSSSPVHHPFLHVSCRSLGWHQCRWGYQNLSEVETVVEKYRQNNIPLDTMWTDIDYMNNYLDFSFDPVRFPTASVKAFVDKLHENGQQYVVITDPGIHNLSGYAPYDEGLRQDLCVATRFPSASSNHVLPMFSLRLFSSLTFSDFISVYAHWRSRRVYLISRTRASACVPTCQIHQERRWQSVHWHCVAGHHCLSGFPA